MQVCLHVSLAQGCLARCLEPQKDPMCYSSQLSGDRTGIITQAMLGHDAVLHSAGSLSCLSEPLIVGPVHAWVQTYISIIDMCCQELTAEADKEVRIRRSDGVANEKLEQQENLLLRAKIAHAKQLLHSGNHSLDMLRYNATT